MEDSTLGINTRFIAIVNHNFSAYSYVPHLYIFKLNGDMFSYSFHAGFWMSTFSHDALEKYCICETTVGGAQYCETRELE